MRKAVQILQWGSSLAPLLVTIFRPSDNTNKYCINSGIRGSSSLVSLFLPNHHHLLESCPTSSWVIKHFNPRSWQPLKLDQHRCDAPLFWCIYPLVFSLILPLTISPPAVSSSSSLTTSSQRPRRTSVSLQPDNMVSVTPALASTVSSLNSCFREETSPVTTVLVESPSTERNSVVIIEFCIYTPKLSLTNTLLLLRRELQAQARPSILAFHGQCWT